MATGARSPLPRGCLTFLLTDIEGSTSLWERAGAAFSAALATHHALLRRLFREYGGQEVKEMGDGFLVAFPGASDALACAIAGQRALNEQSWPVAEGHPQGVPLRVRMALHTGEVEISEGEHHGLVLHAAHRILQAGHGGQILAAEETAGLLQDGVGEGVRLVDVGVYRLRDLATPMRLFEVEYPDRVPAEYPPLRADAGYAGYVPQPMTRFFGREAEINQLAELLSAPSARLVTLTGPGGSGKTRLAIEVARQMAPLLSGAVWFVALGELLDDGLIVESVREVLQVPRLPDLEALDQVMQTLARQPALLVLDNFEHLVEGGVPLVRTLLERLPRLTCLVTSRQPLGLSGEQEYSVAPLLTPPREGEAGRSAAELVRYASVQLFVDRARAVRPEFQVTARNAVAVGEVCRRLDGLPLALELGAARLGVLNPAQMLPQLERRFDLLVSRKRDIPPRHRTLRAALDWSFQSLPPEPQRFFARLSVFRGGWTLEAAQSVCEGPGALDALERLREASLVVTEEGAEGVRYRLLETLREYGAEQLGEEERAVLARRHLEYYVTLAERAEGQFSGPEQYSWLERLKAEEDNFWLALDTAEGTEAAELGLRLASSLQWFWRVRGYHEEGRSRLARLMALPAAQARTHVRAKALSAQWALAMGLSDLKTRRAIAEESLAIFRELGDRSGIMWSLLGVAGATARGSGGIETARPLYEEALAVAREIGSEAMIANALQGVGYVAEAHFDYFTARDLFTEALEIHRRRRDPRSIAYALTILGQVAQRQGDLDAAEAVHAESLEINRTLGVWGGITWAQVNLGHVAWARGDLETARSHYEECLAVERAHQEEDTISWPIFCLGRVALAGGHLHKARVLLLQSLTQFHRLDQKDGIAHAHLNLGHAARAQGNSDAARADYGTALRLFQELGDRWGIALSLDALAALAALQAQGERAARLFGAVQSLRETCGLPRVPIEQPSYDSAVAAARAALAEESFTAAWAEGRQMPLEQAITCALEEVSGA